MPRQRMRTDDPSARGGGGNLLFAANFNAGTIGLKHLAALPALQELNIGHTAVRGTGLKSLADLKELRTLYLYNSAVTDAGLKVVLSSQAQVLRLTVCL